MDYLYGAIDRLLTPKFSRPSLSHPSLQFVVALPNVTATKACRKLTRTFDRPVLPQSFELRLLRALNHGYDTRRARWRCGAPSTCVGHEPRRKRLKGTVEICAMGLARIAFELFADCDGIRAVPASLARKKR